MHFWLFCCAFSLLSFLLSVFNLTLAHSFSFYRCLIILSISVHLLCSLCLSLCFSLRMFSVFFPISFSSFSSFCISISVFLTLSVLSVVLSLATYVTQCLVFFRFFISFVTRSLLCIAIFNCISAYSYLLSVTLTYFLNFPIVLLFPFSTFLRPCCLTCFAYSFIQ